MTSLILLIFRFWVWISSPKQHSAPLICGLDGYKTCVMMLNHTQMWKQREKYSGENSCWIRKSPLINLLLSLWFEYFFATRNSCFIYICNTGPYTDIRQQQRCVWEKCHHIPEPIKITENCLKPWEQNGCRVGQNIHLPLSSEHRHKAITRLFGCRYLLPAAASCLQVMWGKPQ